MSSYTKVTLQSILKSTQIEPPIPGQGDNLNKIAYKSILKDLCQNIINKKCYHPMVTQDSLELTIFEFARRYSRTSKNKKKDHFTAKEIEELTLAIDSHLLTVPYGLTILLPIPKLTSKDTSLSKNIELISNPGETFSTTYSVERSKTYEEAMLYSSSRRKLIRPSTQLPRIRTYESYLQITDNGYVDLAFEKYASYDPINIMKIFIGLHLAYDNLIYSTNNAYKFLILPGPYPYYIYRREQLSYVKTVDTSLDDQQFLYSLQSSDDAARLDETNTLISPLLKSNKNPRIGELQSSIKNALYWLYESQKGEHEHLRIMHLCSGFDAFFNQGDSDELKKRIIASVISETIEHELLIANNLKELQKYRNAIVHGDATINYAADFISQELYANSIESNSVYLKKYIINQINKLIASI